ncbi:MAG: glycosyltransferase family 4 protein [Paramuribaculum sp.]|nr:glycosyltransferase family 4 protein [Paramuribaculum sp.]
MYNTDSRNTKTLAIIGIRGFPGVQGGVESHCAMLAPYLASEFSCRVYRRKPYLTDESSTPVGENITFIDLPSTRIKGFETVWHTLLCCMHLLFHRVNVVNVHNIGPGMFTPLLRIMGIKVVLTYHSPNYEHDKWGKGSKLLLRISEKLALTWANHIIFVSPVQRAKYSQNILNKSHAIPNGIPPVSHSDRIDFLKSHNITPRKYILAVGRLTPEKGFDTLIKAVNLLSEPYTLVIAGSCDHDPKYMEYLKSCDINNRTIFTGYTTGEPLNQLYSHARLYVLSSRNEGFPMVLLEAMSHSLPVICTDIPAAHIIELPPHQYTPVDNPEQCARTIETILAEPDERTDYNLNAYHWQDIARQTCQVYDSLLNRKEKK